MTDETYKGWPNRETWLADFWITKDDLTRSHAQNLAEQALAKHPDDADMILMEYARSLEFDFDLRSSDLIRALPSFYRDLLSSAWSRIDWEALAKKWF